MPRIHSVPAVSRPIIHTGQTGIFRFLLVLFVACISLNSGDAGASLTLTPATVNAGWTQVVFISGYTPDKNGIGPLGITFTDEGGVLVADTYGNVRLFPDSDGQAVANTPVAYSYGGGKSDGLARVGNRFFMAQPVSNAIIELNADGTPKQAIVSFYTATNVIANPNNGHLFASSVRRNFILDVDPVAKKAVSFVTLPFGDGDGLATDGVTLYVETGEHILGYRLSDKKLVFDSGFLLGADGIAIGTGSLAGQLFVNTNYGQIFQIDLKSQIITLIATGGSRGDYIAVDPNGSLLVTTGYGVWRLTPPAGDSLESARVSVKTSTVVGSLSTLGTVTLSTPAPKNMVVLLTSTNTAANVDTTVTVPAGFMTATFAIATTAVSAPVSGNITATLNGFSSSAKLTVRPIGVKSFTLKSGTVKGGNTVSATVTLEATAAPGDITVTFDSSDPSVVPVPASVTIPAGTKSKTFTVSTKKIATMTTVTLSATANQIAKNVNLTVTP